MGTVVPLPSRVDGHGPGIRSLRLVLSPRDHRSSFQHPASRHCSRLRSALPGFLTSTQRLNPLTGDEPFYVMTAISLVEDGDLDETNNYANRDYERFYPAVGPTADGWAAYPDPLPPHQSHTRTSRTL
ncbi:MAG: hypothetical protein KatS3mg059_0821 [Thermomicrobiales bacterium]|nr:MAG: hypothetical protein KatS3mg059_0821 [Thermomicrobiales bacterium]